MKSLIKDLVPPVVLRAANKAVKKFAGSGPGFWGDYPSYQEALEACARAGNPQGYEEPGILKKIEETFRNINVDEVIRSYPHNPRFIRLFPAMALAFERRQDRSQFKMIEFGGSLNGILNYARPLFPRDCQVVNWIIESPALAEIGTRIGETGERKFVTRFNDARLPEKVDFLAGINSFQCSPDPEEALSHLIQKSNSVLISSIPWVPGARNRLTVQIVPEHVYGKAYAYPIWFFGTDWLETKLQEYGFSIILNWDVPEDTYDLAGTPVLAKGLFAVRN